jgi:thymidine phosphorylase
VFLDVKVGDGGFCKTIQEATLLSKTMLQLFKRFQRKAVIHITNMNQPLGRAVGNAIEVKASIDYLSNKPECTQAKALIDEFIVDILLTTKVAKNKTQAISLIDEVISSGKALAKFYE